MCPVCRCEEFTVFGSPYYAPEVSKFIRKDYKVVKCRNCSLYYIYPEIDFSPEEWKSLYNTDYFRRKSSYYERNREKVRKKRFDYIEQYSNRKVINFLDIGCGEGHCLLEAEKRGWTAFGLDITDNRPEELKRDSIRFINSDLLNSVLESDFFDVIYLDSVLEHVINPFEYLLEVRRILKPGGIIYIGVPNEDSLFNYFRKIFYLITNRKISNKIKPFKTPYHVIGFNRNSLKFALEKSRFKILNLRNFANRLEFLNARFLTKDFLVLLALLPVYLIAVLLRKEIYLEAYIQK